MAKFLTFASKAAAQDKNAEIYDRLAPQPRNQRGTLYYYADRVDPDDGEAVLEIDDENVLNAAELAALLEEAGLSPELIDLLFILNLDAKLKISTDKDVSKVILKLKPEKLKLLIADLENNEELKTKLLFKLKDDADKGKVKTKLEITEPDPKFGIGEAKIGKTNIVG